MRKAALDIPNLVGEKIDFTMSVQVCYLIKTLIPANLFNPFIINFI